MCSDGKLVDNLVMDTLYQIITDKDGELGYLKGLVSSYFYWQEKFEEDFSDTCYNKMVEAEERLRSYIRQDVWSKQEF